MNDKQMIDASLRGLVVTMLYCLGVLAWEMIKLRNEI